MWQHGQSDGGWLASHGSTGLFSSERLISSRAANELLVI